MREVIAMVKQLWFMTLSRAHLRWPELFRILARIQGNDQTDKHCLAMRGFRCSILILL